MVGRKHNLESEVIAWNSNRRIKKNRFVSFITNKLNTAAKFNDKIFIIFYLRYM